MKPWMAYTLCFIGVCGHASSEFVAKVAQTPGPEFSVWRFMIGGACLLLLTQLWPGQRDLIGPLRRDGIRIVLLSCLGMAAGQLIFHWSLDFADVVQVATMVTAMPLFVVFVDRLLNGVQIARPKLISGLGAFIGVVLLLSNGFEADMDFGGPALIGTAMALLCAVIGAFYLVLAKPLILTYGPVRMTAYTFAIGFFFLYAVVGLAWNIWINPLEIVDKQPVQIAGIVTIGVWNTAIAMAVWMAGLAAAPDGQRANYMFFLKPVIAALLAIAILGEPLSALQVLAIAAICSCVALEYYWTTRRERMARQPAE